MSEKRSGNAPSRGVVGGPSGESAFDSGSTPYEATISVCIICRNEADKLGPCLASVAWADEVIVMDLASNDGSAAIARDHGIIVIERTPLPIVEPLRNEVAEVARGEWILALDPDERVTPGLARELAQLARRTDIDAIVTPRMNYDLGYPPSSPIHRYEPQIRMYRRRAVRWPEIPNALPQIPERRLHRLPWRDDLVIIHERNRTIPEVLERVIRYAPAEAQSMFERGSTFSGRAMLGVLAQSIHKQFLIGRPWRDGVPGLLRAGILVGYKFYVWAAFWQVSGARRTAEDDRLVRQLGAPLEILRLGLRFCGAGHRLAARLKRYLSQR